jgi:hypothetical protein
MGLNMVLSEIVKFLSLLNPLELRLDNFTFWLHWPGGINKDPIVRLDGA